nr:hypothetical protein [Paraburkholderia aromaticivorans]
MRGDIFDRRAFLGKHLERIKLVRRMHRFAGTVLGDTRGQRVLGTREQAEHGVIGRHFALLLEQLECAVPPTAADGAVIAVLGNDDQVLQLTLRIQQRGELSYIALIVRACVERRDMQLVQRHRNEAAVDGLFFHGG